MAENGRRQRGAQEWGELLRQQRASGLPVPAFCRREGISAWTFYGWRSRLRAGRPRRAESRPPAPAAEVTPFIDLGALSTPAAQRWEVRVDLGGGIVSHLVRS